MHVVNRMPQNLSKRNNRIDLNLDAVVLDAAPEEISDVTFVIVIKYKYYKRAIKFMSE